MDARRKARFVFIILTLALLGSFLGCLFGVLLKELDHRENYVEASCTVNSSSIITKTCSSRTCVSSTTSSNCYTRYYSCYLVSIIASYTPTKAPNDGIQYAGVTTGTTDYYSTALNWLVSYMPGSTFQCYYNPKNYRTITIGFPSIVAGAVSVSILGFFLLIFLCYWMGVGYARIKVYRKYQIIDESPLVNNSVVLSTVSTSVSASPPVYQTFSESPNPLSTYQYQSTTTPNQPLTNPNPEIYPTPPNNNSIMPSSLLSSPTSTTYIPPYLTPSHLSPSAHATTYQPLINQNTPPSQNPEYTTRIEPSAP